MRIRALCSFSGSITMCKGQIREYNNEAVLRDLLHTGYVEEVKGEPEVQETTNQPKKTRKPRKKAVKTVEDQ